MACTDIVTTKVDACGWVAGADGNQGEGYYGIVLGHTADGYKTLYNFHGSRDVVATVQLTVTTKGVAQIESGPYLLKALPKTTPEIKGGRPSSVDFAGVARRLGCEWTRTIAGETVSHYDWKVLSACFVDDPACPPTTIPLKSAPVNNVSRCDAACATSDPTKCIKNSISGKERKAVLVAYNELTRTPSGGFELVSIVNAAGLPNSCQARQFVVDVAGRGTASGDQCLTFYTPYLTKSFALELPSSITGSVVRPTPGDRRAIINFAGGTSPMLYETDAQDHLLNPEAIGQLAISDKDLTVAGPTFCSRTTFGD
jgi:hypothetical protein